VRQVELELRARQERIEELERQVEERDARILDLKRKLAKHSDHMRAFRKTMQTKLRTMHAALLAVAHALK